MTYSEKIKMVREKLLLTQDELAIELGVSPITICRWETKKCVPNIKAKKAFRAFCLKNGVSIEDL